MVLKQGNRPLVLWYRGDRIMELCMTEGTLFQQPQFLVNCQWIQRRCLTDSVSKTPPRWKSNKQTNKKQYIYIYTKLYNGALYGALYQVCWV